jgi:hypothetical protein
MSIEGAESTKLSDVHKVLGCSYSFQSLFAALYFIVVDGASRFLTTPD